MPPDEVGDVVSAFRKIMKFDGTEKGAMLIVGPPGSGKSLICLQIIHDLLNSDGSLVYASTERSPMQALERMKRLGWDVESVSRRVKFVDLYSWQLDGDTAFKEMENGCRLCPAKSLDINLTSRYVQSQLAAKGGLLFTDSLSTLVSLLGEHDMKNYLRMFNARVREVGALVSTVTSGVHSTEFIADLYFIHESVLELKYETEGGLKRYFRIAKSDREHPIEWMPFSITDHGIELKALS